MQREFRHSLVPDVRLGELHAGLFALGILHPEGFSRNGSERKLTASRLVAGLLRRITSAQARSSMLARAKSRESTGDTNTA